MRVCVCVYISPLKRARWYDECSATARRVPCITLVVYLLPADQTRESRVRKRQADVVAEQDDSEQDDGRKQRVVVQVVGQIRQEEQGNFDKKKKKTVNERPVDGQREEQSSYSLAI